MKIRLLIFLLFTLVLNSCNKKALPPKDDETLPVFYFKGNVGGLPLAIDAGVNAYYMKSSYYQDSNSVYVFKGELKQKDCSNNCSYGVTVLINDYKVSPSGSMHIDSSLALTSYQYNDGNIEPMFYVGNFAPRQTNLQNASFTWMFSDGSSWNYPTCTKTLKSNKTYTCSLQENTQMFGSIDHSNVFHIGNPVQTNIIATRLTPLNVYSYKFIASNLPVGTAPFTYFWEFGDGNTSTQPLTFHEYLSTNYYTTKLTLVDANMDTCVSYYQVPAVDGLFGEANYSAYFTPVPNPKALSAVTILITDANGLVYSSGLLNQVKSNHFQIVSVENYSAPDNNTQLFKKIKIKFNCTVYNGTNALEIKDAECVIAVTYKN